MPTATESNARAELVATRRHNAEMLDADREFQTRADAAFATCNLGAAPRRQHGQNVTGHRAAVVDALLAATSHLPTMRPEWRGFDPRSLVTSGDEAGANAVANVAIADSVAAFTAPVGPLRESVTRDSSGREVRKFYGDPEFCWRPFKPRTIRLVTKFLEPHRGRPAPNAPKPVSTLMSDGSVRPAR